MTVLIKGIENKWQCYPREQTEYMQIYAVFSYYSINILEVKKWTVSALHHE